MDVGMPQREISLRPCTSIASLLVSTEGVLCKEREVQMKSFLHGWVSRSEVS